MELQPRMETPGIETIIHGLEPIALILRAGYNEPGLHFLTPSTFSQQLAFMRHEKDRHIPPHVHNLVSRQVLYTQEVLFLRRGKVQVNLYSSAREFILSRTLVSGDVILLCGGGHSLKMLEESEIIEVKQGPYAGEGDKTRFEEDPQCR
jgi:hypothetical protein